MGTRTTLVQLYKPADNEVFDQQLNDNTNYDLIDAEFVSELGDLQAHIDAASPHSGHATYLANVFTGTQTVRVGMDVIAMLLDTPARTTAGSQLGESFSMRAHSYDTIDH